MRNKILKTLLASQNKVGDQKTETLIKVAQIATAFCAVGALLFTGISFCENSKVSKEGIRPLLSIRPITAEPTTSVHGKFVGTTIQVVNYSGFDAFNVTVDMRYRTGPTAMWIREWVNAYKNSKRPELKLDIKDADTYTVRSGEGRAIMLRGGLDIEESVCKSDLKRLPIDIWTQWDSEKGQRFEKIETWQLLCTEVYDGKSFSFEPAVKDQ